MKYVEFKIFAVLWVALMAQLSLAENNQTPDNVTELAEVITYKVPNYAWLTHTRRGNRMFRVNCAFTTYYLFDNNVQAFYNNGKQLDEKEFCARNR